MSEDEECRPLRGDDSGVCIDGDIAPWDEVRDIIVIGFGAAGASAAIEARTRGADVLVADRGNGGGASRRSAGVVYLGGGTRLQKQAGWEDSPEDMYRYLKLEAGDVVTDATLRAFCECSVATFEWLCAMGVPFPAGGDALKTSYPPDDCTLYFSGNELTRPYSDSARPAPRGHRALGKGLTGHLVFDALRRMAMKLSAEIRLHARAERLVVSDSGAVLGAVLSELSPAMRVAHEAALQTVTYGGLFSAALNNMLRGPMRGIEASGRRRFVRVRGGVILSAGGFVYNPEMMRKYAPAYADASMRLGTAGDDGAGIRIGRAAGGATDRMERCCAWRFINPPSAWIHGILIGRDGTRICNEELYGATIGRHLAERYGGRGHLVIDAEMMSLARRELRKTPMGGFQLVFGTINNYLNYKRADTLGVLAAKCGIAADALVRTVDRYNADAARDDDQMLKTSYNVKPLINPPFYAIDCDFATAAFPTPCLTLGGLVVDGLTARVVRDTGDPIEGLYAAGRNAVGVSSFNYVSGLSMADGIFSGRNAGAHAAGRAIAADAERMPCAQRAIMAR